MLLSKKPETMDLNVRLRGHYEPDKRAKVGSLCHRIVWGSIKSPTTAIASAGFIWGGMLIMLPASDETSSATKKKISPGTNS